jgi:hypothetical protein
MMAQSINDQFDDRENVNEWIRFGMKLAVQSVLHPFEYSKVLIQVSKKSLFTCRLKNFWILICLHNKSLQSRERFQNELVRVKIPQ